MSKGHRLATKRDFWNYIFSYPTMNKRRAMFRAVSLAEQSVE